MISTYSDLKTAIANYLARTDLTDQIPDFIRFAEIRLRRELRIRQMLKTVTTSTTGGDNTVELPADFLEVRDLILATNPVQPLDYMSPSLFSRNSRRQESGKPIDYTIMANDFLLAPIPDTAYTVEMIYFASPTFLSDSNTSNVFMANTPDALLYGSLIEAEPYIMNDARMATWASMYNRAIETLKVSDERSQYSGVPIAMQTTMR